MEVMGLHGIGGYDYANDGMIMWNLRFIIDVFYALFLGL
jgi:hypothetical protein